MKTIRQIADEIGVSKQAVYKRSRGKLKEQLLPYTHTVDGVVYIEEQGETLIKRDFFEKVVSNGVHTETHTNNTLDTVIELLKSNNETLKNELDIKNNQIDELNARLAEAHAIINSEQLLHGGTLQKQLHSSDNETQPLHTDGQDGEELDVTVIRHENKQKKRVFFGLFNRNS